MSGTTSRSSSPASRGYTLVDTMVATTIVAALVAVILPALSTAQQAAISSTCQSNQRQIGVAAGTYESDYSGLYPAGIMFPNGYGAPGQYDPDWDLGEVRNGWSHNWDFTPMFAYLAPYAESNDIFVCPRNDDIRDVGEITAEQPNGNQYGWWQGYNFNAYLHGHGETDPGIFSAPQRLEQPSAVMFIGEGTRFETLRLGYMANAAGIPFAGMFADGFPGTDGRQSSIHGSHPWVGTSEANILAVANNSSHEGHPYAVDALRERHADNSVNVLHYDGHTARNNVFERIDIYDPAINWNPAGNFFVSGSAGTTGLSSSTERLFGIADNMSRVRLVTP